ncbi:cupin domain-containing protein [Rudanella paleaurantiibacter]|uniref:Cupin domain-containing protein n=1 Tax=Rudanella paleaurantiibacter TaxID=2614655 RepID=A0A7J5TZP2_9BACT|nr:cupin domain-containing protein [Rudanella paleaurantiibacter]KAB7730958.1 cupin domain-containing protein [Rudanella paleaurantiibacter]
MQREQRFVDAGELAWETAGEGVKRQIMTFDNDLMMVKVAFETGGIGTLHNHPHTQISYVERGRFEIDIDGTKRELKAGDAYYIPPYVMHGAVCLEAGVLVDVFTPMREDFLNHD